MSNANIELEKNKCGDIIIIDRTSFVDDTTLTIDNEEAINLLLSMINNMDKNLNHTISLSKDRILVHFSPDEMILYYQLIDKRARSTICINRSQIKRFFIELIQLTK